MIRMASYHGSLIQRFFFFLIGSHLLSHAVSSIVPSAAQVLTIVFGMGTGVSPARIATEIRVTKVSADEKWKLRGELVPRCMFTFSSICDAVATEQVVPARCSYVSSSLNN